MGLGCVRSSENLFATLKMDLTKDLIKFLKIVGEYGEVARPLLIGFYDA